MRWGGLGIILLVLLFSTGCPATAPAGGGPTFAVTFGGAGGDGAHCARQTPDGGYIVAGFTAPPGGTGDAWLIKTDASGKETWSRTFGGADWDEANSVWPTRDGGYILAGGTGVGSDEGDAWLIKTDASGDEVWTRTFGGAGANDAYSVRQTRDGGYIVAGHRDYDAWVMKTGPSGEETWSRTFGEEGMDEAQCALETRDGGYIVAGWTKSLGAGGYDGLLVRLDPTGKVVWSRTFGDPNTDTINCVQETRDRGFVMAGGTESAGGGGLDAWLIKTDASGNEVWSRTFGGPDWDVACSIQQARDGGYIVAGNTKSFGAGDLDAWLIKVDRSGNEVWSRTFGGSEGESAFAVQQTRDGGYIVAADTESIGAGSMDAWLIKTDSKGMVREGP